MTRTSLQRSAVVLAMSVAATLVLPACGSSAGSSEASSSVSGSTGAQSSPSFPVTVTQCGRTLTFDKPPQSIVVDGERYALPLVEMGAGDRISAVFSRASGILNQDFRAAPGVVEKIRALPSLVGDASSSYPSREAFVAARPDLVVEAYNGDAGGGDPKATDALVELGIPVFTLSPSCSGASLENSMNDTLKLGTILGLRPQADRIVAGYRERIAAAGARARDAGPGDPTVFFLDGFGEKGEIWANTGGFASELVAAGGGQLVPSNTTPDDIYTVSREAVVASKPDILLTYTSEGTPTEEKVGRLWPLIKGSKAEQSRKFAVVPYPDGAGNVEFVEGLADAVVTFKSGG